MLVQEFLEQSAQRFPEKTALVHGDHRLSYLTLDELSNRLAHGLAALGVRRGDRVAVCLDNSVEAVIAIFGILKAGAVFMMINPTTKAEKLTFILNNSRARSAVLHARKTAELGAEWRPAAFLESVIVVGALKGGRSCIIPRRVEWLDVLPQHSGAVQPLPKTCIDADLAALIYTSGSTGSPKGVMMTHLNIVSAATSITTYLENRSDDIILNVLPLSFDYGLYQVIMGFKVGGTVVLERSFVYPREVIDRLVQEKVTGFPIVPTISAILLQMDLSRYDFSSLRYITNTAAALPPHHIPKLRKLFPQTQIYSMYGLTECKRVSYLPPDQIDVRPTSVGKAIPNEEVYIVDEQGHRVGPREVGELVVRGSNVMRGYWELPEETDRVLKPGPLPGEKVLYTGDLFWTDEEGFLYFVGRKDDIIKTRGEKVSPKEVENVLYALDEVVEAAVVGVPDDVLGQAIKAVIKVREGDSITQADVLRHCAKHLEDFMVPKIIEFADALPKTQTGKINKRILGGVAG